MISTDIPAGPSLSPRDFLTPGNLKGFVYAFSRGFADSLRGAVDLFHLDSKLTHSESFNRTNSPPPPPLPSSSSSSNLNSFQANFNFQEKSPQKDLENLRNFAKRRSVERRRLMNDSQNRKMSFGGSTDYRNTNQPKILERTLKCCALNGLVFWASIILFENGILPVVRFGIFTFFGSGSSGDTLWSYARPILSASFSALWVLPFFLLSKVVNAVWFQDIADSAFKSSKGRARTMSSFSVMIADTVFTLIIESIFLLQGKFCSFLPINILGNAVNLIHLCLLHSLYCFEYKWFNQGLELHKRLMFIELNWPYFLGFGLPLAVLTSMPSSLVVSGCVFSILFPLFIVSGNQASVVTGSVTVPLHLFSPTIYLSNAIFGKLLSYNKSVPEKRRRST